MNPSQLGLELGQLRKPPPRAIAVELAETVERDPHANLVWEISEQFVPDGPVITSQSWVEDGGSTWFGNTLNLALRIDYEHNTITVAAKDGNRQVLLEALARVALPMVAQKHGGLVIHASAACLGDRAVMLSAPSGSGKSSLLVGLVSEGWHALSEDQCVLDLDENGHYQIWPGPNWVRLNQGTTPVAPVGERRFQEAHKIAWSLDRWMARGPGRLERIVFLERPSGNAPVLDSISPDETIARLISQTPWLHTQESFSKLVLPQIVDLALRIPGFRLQVPWRTDWLPHAVALLTGP